MQGLLRKEVILRPFEEHLPRAPYNLLSFLYDTLLFKLHSELILD
jgi:hypothetical protein